MTEEYQPDPDALLKAIQKEETKKSLGKLKIFFGMSAGVGKTYAMLEEAQRRLKEGISIIVGTINTHGRKETEELLKGLPIIPEKWVKYKETVFEEMDLEAVLQAKPSIVLVDELAHTNVPGSRHAKRWQDVIELLDNGIDVYTTLNVQHVESRKDLIESFAKIQIRETVPDIILERASTIELIDLSPEELLQRLKEGKVYLGNQSQIAARNFFKEDTLTALREVALRFTAEKVDHDLHSLLSQGKGWKTREKIMVAISPSPSSVQLIRRTRRRAFELDAPWVAVYVDTGKALSDEEQTQLTQHLNLAQELGAEVVTTSGNDVATAIQSVARQKNITQLVMGRPAPRRFWDFFRHSLVDRLEEENQQLDIVILRPDRLVKIYQGILSHAPAVKSSLFDYAIVLATIIVIGFIGFLVLPYIGYKAVGDLFLLGILLLSFFVSQGPILFAAILSTFTWDFFFMPPVFSFSIPYSEDLALTLIFFSTALILGISTSRIRGQDESLKRREKKLENLYEIETEIANAKNFQSLRLNICSRLQSIFNGRFDILIKSEGEDQLVFDSQLALLQQEKERATALWVFQNGKMAGWSTSTLPSAQGLYLPIKFSNNTLGVLVYSPKRERLLAVTEMNFLQVVSQQIGTYLERYLFEERLLNQAYATQAEKMHNSILHSLSQRFHFPLKTIFQTVDEIKRSQPTQETKASIQNIEQASEKLRFMVDNLLSFAEIESGFVKLEKDKHNVKEFIENTFQELQSLFPDHPIKLSFPDEPIFLTFDSRLIELALKNLLTYACITAVPGSPIIVQSRQDEDNIFRISISNESAPLSSEEFTHLFDKSYQISDTKFQDERMGLAISKSIIDIHQGKIEVEQRSEPEGLTFFLLFRV